MLKKSSLKFFILKFHTKKVKTDFLLDILTDVFLAQQSCIYRIAVNMVKVSFFTKAHKLFPYLSLHCLCKFKVQIPPFEMSFRTFDSIFKKNVASAASMIARNLFVMNLSIEKKKKHPLFQLICILGKNIFSRYFGIAVGVACTF